jgi:hypothetical protein
VLRLASDVLPSSHLSISQQKVLTVLRETFSSDGATKSEWERACHDIQPHVPPGREGAGRTRARQGAKQPLSGHRGGGVTGKKLLPNRHGSSPMALPSTAIGTATDSEQKRPRNGRTANYCHGTAEGLRVFRTIGNVRTAA